MERNSQSDYQGAAPCTKCNMCKRFLNDEGSTLKVPINRVKIKCFKNPRLTFEREIKIEIDVMLCLQMNQVLSS